MRLNLSGIKNKSEWEKAGIKLPAFDIAAMRKATEENPKWIHFGTGNIFRAFPAAVQQFLLEKNITDTGIIAAEGYDYEIIDSLFIPCDNLSLVVTLKSDGSTEKAVIASIAKALKADSGHADFSILKDIFKKPSLQIASFTITEKGYNLGPAQGVYYRDIEDDFTKGPEKPQSYMGKIAALLYTRFCHGAHPLAMASMDNCSHNGDRLREAMLIFAENWQKNKYTGADFTAWLENPQKISFPWSMIDKITPRPDDSIKAMLIADGLEGAEGRVTGKGTYIAPFVNAEETQYLVIEDQFPNGRPLLEKAGIIFTERQTVDMIEKMKVCTCLNPLHTALAIFGCLLGYTRISEEMKNPYLVKLIEGIGYKEGLPVVSDPGIISPEKFIQEVIKLRLPNPFMPDSPQRIATDSSLKIPIRFGETIKAYMASNTLKTSQLKLIPLVLAAWLRYLLGIDDEGKTFELSPDPQINEILPFLSGIKLGQKGPFHNVLKPILSNKKYFAVDLYDAGLGSLVETCFEELLAGKGAVAAALKRHTEI